MTHIEIPTEFDDEQQRLLSKTLLGPDGEPLNVFKTLAVFPELMRRINAMGGYFFVAGDLDARTREIVILRVAARTGSDYEMAQHRWIGAKAGLSAAEIDASADPELAHAWPGEEGTLLTAVDEILTSDTLSDATWNQLATSRSQKEIVELVVLVGYYRLLAGVLNSIGVEVDPVVLDVLRSGTPEPTV